MSKTDILFLSFKEIITIIHVLNPPPPHSNRKTKVTGLTVQWLYTSTCIANCTMVFTWPLQMQTRLYWMKYNFNIEPNKQQNLSSFFTHVI